MKGLFLVFILLLVIMRYSFILAYQKVDSVLIYVIGVYSENIVDKKFAANIIQLAEERGLRMIAKEYDNYFDILKDCNTFKLDFAILPEDFYIDSCLGLNVFEDTQYTNNQFIVGLYFNFFYLVSTPLFKNKERTMSISKVSDIKDFHKIYKRNFVIGTENKRSNSYMNLLLILSVYGFNGISIDKYDENKEYTDKDVFIVTASKKELYKKYINQKIDAVFVLDIQNSRFVSSLVKNSNSVLINFDLERTVFDSLLSNYYSKKNLGINELYTSKTDTYFSKNAITPRSKITYYNYDDTEEVTEESSSKNREQESKNILSNLGQFKTRSIRNLLISNDKTDGKIVYEIVNLVMRNNNFLINKILYNKFSNAEHGLFEPVDIVYVDKNIRYHKGSRKFFEQLKFLTFDKNELKKLQTDSDEKYDYYWKYSKIGLKHFKFD